MLSGRLEIIWHFHAIGIMQVAKNKRNCKYCLEPRLILPDFKASKLEFTCGYLDSQPGSYYRLDVVAVWSLANISATHWRRCCYHRGNDDCGPGEVKESGKSATGLISA